MPALQDLPLASALTDLLATEGANAADRRNHTQKSRRSFCRHATSHDNYVFGLCSSLSFPTEEENDEEEVQWKTCLKANVIWLTSNTSGSVIVAATDAGTVSVLRGSDGHVLVTRKVSTAAVQDDNDDDDCKDELFLSVAPMMTWITGAPDGSDSLLIESRNSSSSSSGLFLGGGGGGGGGGGDGTAGDDNNNNSATHFTLVSHIDADTTTNNAPSSPSPMKISSFSVPRDVRAIAGCYYNNSAQTIRLLACTAEGSLSVFEYSVADAVGKIEITKENIPLLLQEDHDSNNSDGGSWSVDYDAGILPITVVGDNNQTYFMFTAAFSQEKTALCWFDIANLQTTSRFLLDTDSIINNNNNTTSGTSDYNNSSNKQKTPAAHSHSRQGRRRRRLKVLAVEPLQSCSSDTLAVAIAVSTPTTSTLSAANTAILVLQLFAEETMGLMVLSPEPHVLYNIPLHEDGLQSVELAAASFSSKNHPYWLRLKLWHCGRQRVGYKAFCPSSSQQLGEITRLLELQQFDQVDKMVKTNGFLTCLNDNDDDNRYACFSPSQVAWRRLQSLLKPPGRFADDSTTIALIQDCFRRLAAGAISETKGRRTALQYLLDASDLIVRSLSEPSLDEIGKVVSLLVSTFDKVEKAFVDDDKKKLVAGKKDGLQERLSAIHFLASTFDDESGNKNIRLAEPFHSIRSQAHLLELLVKNGYFAVAESLWRSSMKQHQRLTPEVLVRSVLNIGPDVPPSRYVNLLSEIVLTSLSIGHELLGAIRAWACRTADAMEEKEDSTGLDAAILLLEVVDRGTKNLQIAVHSSFAVSTPFVEREESRTVKLPVRSVDSLSDSRDSTPASTITPSSGLKSRQNSSFKDGIQPIPTILELGALKRGATKSRLLVIGGADDAEEACVEEKLRDALCLRQARQAGLRRGAVTLRSFVKKGGALFVAKELIALLSRNAYAQQDAIQLFLSETVKPFCQTNAVDFDKALLEYVVARCRVKTGVEQAVSESACIARCCSSDIMKSHAALSVLRAALLCQYLPDCLSGLSKDAMDWASCDSSLQSEVEEASRILLIDAIVLKYCGSGARQLFQVDSPIHAVRLMEFVTRQFHEESVLSDALSLCDAYIHLNAGDVSYSLLEHAILQGDPDLCTSFMSQLYSRDSALAEKVLAGAVSFAEELLVESSSGIRTSTNPDQIEVYRSSGKAASECASVIVGVALQHTRTISAVAASEIKCFLIEDSLECLLEDFQRINRLQNEFSIWFSLSDLSSARRIFDAVSMLLRPIIGALAKRQLDSMETKVARARRACSLLVGSSTKDANDMWVAVCAKAAVGLVVKHNDEEITEFMRVLGMLDTNGRDVSALLSVALALCTAVSADTGDSGWHRIARAASFLRDRSLTSAADTQLPMAVSFGALVETACEMLARADEGRGEALDSLRQSMRAQVWKQILPPGLKEAQSTLAPKAPLRQPTLHKSWYVGDGLLLPPRETLSFSIHFCKNIIGDLNDSAGEVLEFLRRSGAHFLSLRVLTASVIHLASTPKALTKRVTKVDWDSLGADASKATASLAERSLGGSSQIGITSGLVDSQLSAAFLLSMRLKQAFKMYKSSLPTALKSHDYSRVFTLANIGKVACSAGENHALGGFFSVGWKGQSRFFAQCQKLARRAQWWAVLREYGVNFDPHRFDEISGPDLETLDTDDMSSPEASKYAATLLLPAIETMSAFRKSSDVLEVCTRYAQSFGLSRELVVKKHIEWYLSCPDKDVSTRDARSELDVCETIVKTSLRFLDCPQKRCLVLRRCLAQLERCKASGQDYERYSFVLALYHETLVQFVGQVPRNCKLQQFEVELDLIDRRRDAIAILSSFFQQDREHDRPDFKGLFVPLMDSFPSESSSPGPPTCGILGRINGVTSEVFDPLQPLEKIISGSGGTTATTALAPMCISLGLPQGFMHARSLILRFQHASVCDTNFPSFENDVIPVFNRIRSSSDRTELAEWCAMQFSKEDDEKLKCLDMALSFAVEASSEIENRRRLGPRDDRKAEAAEEKALSTVKRISSVKAVLSDILRIKTILRGISPSSQQALTGIIEGLVAELDIFVRDRPVTPESLIDFILSMGSLAAANATLDTETPLGIAHLRELCAVVHDSSKAMSEQHSHVLSGRHCRRLARIWLFYGDSGVSVSGSKFGQDTHSVPIRAETLAAVQEDETVNFVMDLADLHGDRDWEADGLQSSAKQRYTSEEEPSAIKATSSREESEASCQRTALRIAFVLAFADGPDTLAGLSSDSENSCQTTNRPLVVQPKRSSLLAKLETKKGSRQEQQVLEHSRELLRLVFAQQASSSTNLFSNDSFDESIHHASREAPKTVTFAMRHRALRAAMILCPQDALERVIQEEGFLLDAVSGLRTDKCSLKTCAFGAFVAKEIEEMTLSLPHSNLGQISSMHYPSYARTLWREHRDVDQKGRMLLLLLEMSLKNDSVDKSFVNSLLEEMTRMHLPRTLLLASERIAKHEDCRLTSEQSLVGPELMAAVSTLAKAVLAEAHRVANSHALDINEAKSALCSVGRLGKVASTFCIYKGGHELLVHLTEALTDLTRSAKHTSFSEGLQSMCFRPVLSESKGSDKAETEANNLLLSDALHRLEASLAEKTLVGKR